MQTAHHRDQAELCLQMARSMSDPQAANILRTAAARHFEQAIELEKGQPISDQVDFSDSFYYRAIRTKVGEALRSQLVPTEPPPEKLLKFLRALDQPKGGHNGGMEEKREALRMLAHVPRKSQPSNGLAPG